MEDFLETSKIEKSTEFNGVFQNCCIILGSTNKSSIAQYVFESIIATKYFQIYNGYEYFLFYENTKAWFLDVILKMKKVVVLFSIFEKLNGLNKT